jgi:deoxyribodipyrimidine photo-lyase
LSPAPSLIWFRHDLRLSDNPALTAAIAHGAPVIPLFILDTDEDLGGASRWWLHHSLAQLGQDLAGLGAPLILLKGRARDLLPALVEKTGSTAVFWNRLYEPQSIARDTALKADLKAKGIKVETFNANLLIEPFAHFNKAGGPFKVFTPFWKTALEQMKLEPDQPAPTHLTPARVQTDTQSLDEFQLLPRKPNWAAGFDDYWQPGERGADAALTRFIQNSLKSYAIERDRPDCLSTSRLSPHLHFGEISPARIFRTINTVCDDRNGQKFNAELGWREFAHYLLFHFPQMTTKSLRPEFDLFPWEDDPGALRAWQKGLTGYPIVDAGMRELWTTGWMHNRVRMIVASFLVKHLMIPWQTGADWFADTLVDADLASNIASWQWVAGSGADAAPYFRIFNPILQGEKFDPNGEYVRKFVPELANVPKAFIHQPWTMAHPPSGYPAPIIDHGAARARALSAFAELGKAA